MSNNINPSETQALSQNQEVLSENQKVLAKAVQDMREEQRHSREALAAIQMAIGGFAPAAPAPAAPAPAAPAPAAVAPAAVAPAAVAALVADTITKVTRKDLKGTLPQPTAGTLAALSGRPATVSDELAAERLRQTVQAYQVMRAAEKAQLFSKPQWSTTEIVVATVLGAAAIGAVGYGVYYYTTKEDGEK